MQQVRSTPDIIALLENGTVRKLGRDSANARSEKQGNRIREYISDLCQESIECDIQATLDY